MVRWTEAQLREYQKSKQGVSNRGLNDVIRPQRCQDVIQFTLPRLTLTLNQWKRLHHRLLTPYRRSLSNEIARLIPENQEGLPFEMAKVCITRFSTQEVDDDGLRGAKLLIDCLLVRSRTHPDGLGVCVDDSPSHMIQEMRSERVRKRSLQRTEVVITRIN